MNKVNLSINENSYSLSSIVFRKPSESEFDEDAFISAISEYKSLIDLKRSLGCYITKETIIPIGYNEDTCSWLNNASHMVTELAYIDGVLYCKCSILKTLYGGLLLADHKYIEPKLRISKNNDKIYGIDFYEIY